MKYALSVLFVLAVVLPGCGSKSQPSAFCQSVDTVKTDINNIKALKGNFSPSALTTDLKKLETDLQAAITKAKDQAKPQVDALKTSIQQLKSTLTQVKDKKMSVIDALPVAKTQAETVQQNWNTLVTSMKC